MVWPFNRSPGKLEARVTALEAEVGAMRVSYADAIQKVIDVLDRVENRYQQRDYRSKQELEKEELRQILGGVDVQKIMSDPSALQEALKNPQLIAFALKKFGKELI